MNTSSPTTALHIRRALERDRADLEAISARTWGGDDYLPHTFTDWLNDASGAFFVAEQGRQVVGTIKLTQFGPEEWWLEGIRVHPDLYQQGIGRALHLHALRYLDNIGGGVVRLSTNITNTAVHRLMTATGFTQLGTYVNHTIEINADSAHALSSQLVLLTPADFSMVDAFITTSPYFEQAQYSSMGRRWKSYLLTTARLQAWLAEQRIYAWYADQPALQGVVILDPPSLRHGQRMDVIYADALADQLAPLAREIIRLAPRLDYTSGRWLVLNDPPRLAAVAQGGWQADLDTQAALFSRPVGSQSAYLNHKQLPIE